MSDLLSLLNLNFLKHRNGDDVMSERLPNGTPAIDAARVPRLALPVVGLASPPIADNRPVLRMPDVAMPQPMTASGASVMPPVNQPMTRPRLAMPNAEPPAPLPVSNIPALAMAAPDMATSNMATPSSVPRLALATDSRAPRREDYGNDFQGAMTYQNDAAGYRPTNHNSRLAGVGLGLARGFEQGGLGGAIFGGLRGAFDKGADEQYAHRLQMGQAGNEVAQRIGQQGAVLKLADDQSQIRARDAATLKSLRDPLPEYDKSEVIDPLTGKPTIVFSNKHDPTQLTYPGLSPVPKLAGERNRQTRERTNPDGSKTLMEYDPDSKGWVEAKIGDKPFVSASTKEPLEDYVISGRTFKLTPAQAASNLTAIEAANIEANNINAMRGRDDAKDEGKRLQDLNMGVYNSSKASAEAYNKSYGELQSNIEAARSIEARHAGVPREQWGKDDQSKQDIFDYSRLEQENARLTREVNSRGQSIKNNPSNYVKQLDSGYLEVQPPPAPSTTIPRPPVQPRRRGGGGAPVAAATPDKVQAVIDRVRRRRQ